MSVYSEVMVNYLLRQPSYLCGKRGCCYIIKHIFVNERTSSTDLNLKQTLLKVFNAMKKENVLFRINLHAVWLVLIMYIV